MFLRKISQNRDRVKGEEGTEKFRIKEEKTPLGKYFVVEAYVRLTSESLSVDWHSIGNKIFPTLASARKYKKRVEKWEPTHTNVKWVASALEPNGLHFHKNKIYLRKELYSSKVIE